MWLLSVFTDGVISTGTAARDEDIDPESHFISGLGRERKGALHAC